jgi:hypothetical protein
MKGKCIWVFVIIIILLFITTFSYAATFKGRVIDADTKEPIEGAAVVAHWREERATIAGPSTKPKDVKEALTDKNGEWVIKGPGGREGGNLTAIFTFLTGIHYTKRPEFIIFKPGYCSWPNGFGIEACKEKIRPKGNGEIMEGKTIELPKLTKREDRLDAQRVGPIYANSDDPKEEKIFLKKQIEFLRLLNEERRNLGLNEYKIYKELKNEK